MKKTLRCCISCILPCGALDVIRIVHVNGRVEEISGTVRAAEVMKAHPKHILKKPTSRPTQPNDDHHYPSGPTIVVVPPDAQLQRGKIYFLIPDHSNNNNNKNKKKPPSSSSRAKSSSSTPQPLSSVRSSSSSSTARRKKRDDQYLSEILSEKIMSSHRERRRARVAVWRPHLESISETLSDAASSHDS